MAKPKGSKEIPGQECMPQVERYKGSDVLGMEYTTARPLSYETGADPDIPLPGKPWTPECCTMCHESTTNGGKQFKRDHVDYSDEYEERHGRHGHKHGRED